MTTITLNHANDNSNDITDLLDKSGLHAEIDRAFPEDFTPAQRALIMADAKAHYEKLFPQTKAGTAQGHGAKRAHGHTSGQTSAPAFVTVVVRRAEGRRGWSESSIKQVVLRGERIKRDVLDAIIKDCSYDNGACLDELTKVERSAQMARYLSWGTEQPPPEPSGEMHEPVAGLLLECADAEVRLQALVAQGAEYDLVLCDPPYGIGYESKRGQRVWGDDKAPLWCIAPLKQLVKRDGCIAIWAGAETLYEWTCALSEAGLAMTIVRWDKVNPVMKGRECVILSSEGRPPRFDTSIRQESLHGTHRLQEAHPTPKPTEVMLPLIEALCPTGGSILDPFMGTCPVGVAAHQLGRRYHGMEIDPKHFATACGEVAPAVALPLAA